MARLFFLSLLASGSLASFAAPWIGVVIAYGIAILTPQAIWHWAFQDVRPVLWVLLPTLAGVVLTGLRGKLNFAALANGRCAGLFLLWLFFLLSYWFGPYVDVGGPYRFHDSKWALETANKLFLLLLMGCLCIDEVRKLKTLIWVTAISLIYLIYWANDQYLSGQVWGRLSGPSDPNGGSVYADENTFALVFVVLLPYLWYLGQGVKQRWLRWALWLAIPFAWHAIFLTASRGGLLGLAVVTLVIGLRSKFRLLGLLLVPALVVAYMWQAGDLMKERADTIESYQTEESASTRLQAWSAARAMMAEYPVFGVGLASFGPAFPQYSPYQPREAHNTFFQIGAESGILAGCLFLLITLASIRTLQRLSKRLARGNTPDATFIHSMSEATLAALIGFMVCAMFLSLQLYELFYYLCLVANILVVLGKRIESSIYLENERAATMSPASDEQRGRLRPNFLATPARMPRGAKSAALSIRKQS